MSFPIEFKFSDSEINLTITLQSMVTLICGDSATGKTLIAKHIHAAVQEAAIRDAVKCSINLDKVYVCLNEMYANEKMYNMKESLIIIDRFDMYATPKLVNFINKSSNTFILMYRDSNIPGLRVRGTDMIELKHENKNGKAYFTTDKY